MPTKVYLLGDNVVMDQTGQSLLSFPQRLASYTWLLPIASSDGVNTPVAENIRFTNTSNQDSRTEQIDSVQDQAGNPFATQADLQKYLQGFIFIANTLYINDDNVNTKEQDTGDIDAFGKKRVSTTGQRLDVEYIYDKQEDIIDEITVGAGTVTHQANARDLYLEVNSAVNGDRAEMASYPVPYTPGNSQFIAITGTINEANIASGNAEVFFRSKITGSVVETVYLQSAWNVDELSSVDWTKSQILEMDFQSLKVGRIRFGLNQGGVFKLFHTIENDNIRSEGYWQTPSLPLFWSCYNDATYSYCEIGYGNDDNAIGLRYKVPVNAGATLRAICGTVKSEGGQDILKIEGFPRKADMGVSRVTVGNTLIPLISIRPKSTFNTFDNLGLVIPLSIGLAINNPIRLVVYHNVTLTGASWVDVDSNVSFTEYDVSATSFSNGHEVYSDYPSTSKNTANSHDSILGKALLWNRKGNETGILTICAVRTTTTSSETLVAIRFKEIR